MPLHLHRYSNSSRALCRSCWETGTKRDKDRERQKQSTKDRNRDRARMLCVFIKNGGMLQPGESPLSPSACLPREHTILAMSDLLRCRSSSSSLNSLELDPPRESMPPLAMRMAHNFSTSSHSSRTIYHIKQMASVSPLATSTNTCKSTRVLSNPRIGILIDHDMVDDELGLIGITQHGQSFLTVVSSGNDGSYYDGPCCSHQGCPTNKARTAR